MNRKFFKILPVAALLLITPAAFAELKLSVFDCGRIMFTDISAFGLSNNDTPVRELFVPCYLIQHDQGTLLWDAGLPLDQAGKGRLEVEEGVSVEYETPLPDQLKAMGLSPSDIDLVAFSHMHWDHVGAANLFADSTLLIQRPEYQAAFISKDNPIFQPDLYMGLENSDRKLLDGDYDVFGDGSVTIVSAPGHTPGHQVLLLQLDNTGPVLLSGDLYHFEVSRELRAAPEFNTDIQQTYESMDKVEALMLVEGADLWIEHNQALADTLKKAPEYYD